jgi:hypothetical protein
MCSDLPRPRCEEYTICTAVAPDAVFTARTYGTGPAYGPRISAQIQLSRTKNLQVSSVEAVRTQNREGNSGVSAWEDSSLRFLLWP